ncbi:hypothetical protein CYMTET_45971 [Cymbomonas tetramitiformis]|uniref:Uncharacterized protein n=1 Tax=Cymbomonas tetramitiformis TaxID=36881 RepID=A0AAE0BX43_9CHLO|nr:hypothetical protein CYMTET_45971 [Cymbomonas tetramitiformis]
MCLLSSAEGAPKKNRQNQRKSNSQDKEIRAKRSECDHTVNSWGPDCNTAGAIERENCILRCVSTECYTEVYGDDALEEGEVDTIRGRNFRNCARTELKNEKQAREAARKAEREAAKKADEEAAAKAAEGGVDSDGKLFDESK